ncbi:uncharacterized protein METZ01_LOCUS63061, partial [marine metagenome]
LPIHKTPPAGYAPAMPRAASTHQACSPHRTSAERWLLARATRCRSAIRSD